MRYNRTKQKSEPKNVVYLFGAGATHAEIANLDQTVETVEGKQAQLGLQISHVSSRVMQTLRRDDTFWEGIQVLKDTKMTPAPLGSPNIELFMSLIESSQIQGWERKARRLKDMVREDIQSILTKQRTRQFSLHRGLIELHQNPITQKSEILTALVSLNYDDVLDTAYKNHLSQDPNYCLDSSTSPPGEGIPLLKLHGSFEWTNDKVVGGRRRSIEIIPLGSTKNYLHPPYSFIWNRALEILMECDTLRVVGCSMSQNDAHLIDLLFKAHVWRGKAFDLEIIDSPDVGERIKRDYGFFPRIITITNIERRLIPEAKPTNPFKVWLKYKAIDMLENRLSHTTYLKKITS